MSDTLAVVGEAPPKLLAARSEASVKPRYGMSSGAAAEPRRISRAKEASSVQAKAAGGVKAVMITAEAERPCQAAGDVTT